jgi:hypothetical protein
MNTEAHIIIAFLYKRSGKPILTESDLYLSLSMDLGWMTTTDAKTFVHQAIDTGLLAPQNQGLAPTFDITTIQIPQGFIPKPPSPKKETKTQEKPDILVDKIIQKTSSHTKLPTEILLSETTMLAQEKKVTKQIAALWIARRNDVDVSEFYDEAQQHLLS